MRSHVWITLQRWRTENTAALMIGKFLRRVHTKIRMYKAWALLERQEKEACSCIQRAYRTYVVKDAFFAVNGALEWFKCVAQAQRFKKEFRKVLTGHTIIMAYVPAYLTANSRNVQGGIFGIAFLHMMTREMATLVIQGEYRRRISYRYYTDLIRSRMLAQVRAERELRRQKNYAAVIWQAAWRGYVKYWWYVERIVQHRAALRLIAKVCEPAKRLSDAYDTWEATMQTWPLGGFLGRTAARSEDVLLGAARSSALSNQDAGEFQLADWPGIVEGRGKNCIKSGRGWVAPPDITGGYVGVGFRLFSGAEPGMIQRVDCPLTLKVQLLCLHATMREVFSSKASRNATRASLQWCSEREVRNTRSNPSGAPEPRWLNEIFLLPVPTTNAGDIRLT